jgi:hypothetical protein
VGEAAVEESRGVYAAPRGSKGWQRSSAAVLPSGIGPCGWERVTRPRQSGRAQARAVPSGGATVSSTPCQARGPTGCQPWTSGRCLARGRLAWGWCEPPQAHQEPATGPAAPFLRWDSTWWGTILGGSALRHQVVAGAGCQERPELREPVAMARAPEAVGADFTATPGQHRLEEAVDAGRSRERQAFPPGAAPPLEAERDVPIFELF